ncbi:PREDICTED: zinc finger CCCH domain-containing protein 13-like isoform X1 [Atta colombica]|uniref:zinc finger CCCH domain-containing protein 13-like isoform X1 n=1 Tax=Atta colombica TaxID=520822 RepID=UPI00084C7BC6|nr:PREDICTED: zinc finger CCCH domain-containing protein 13-like isoform X1 [Atta colombica]XP_018045754.1 PREDICTED: zinc finger CCCH domain-containing protein 13-like isoform X1 [Atta colombica]XP_018045755.1 PREDICTED: zinc finger CCCH domain-containing protein 13-like isoform X1 [Atta colombica]XP_018045756.1 PREDICTED: zinc finger CCCH domain-containing protein 13-like isoform X1 [Atta colombica]XP_018045757.1 PREDICTED: zinc finger CCCH domain-containing protein 13-like isoform X1 [Atta c
MNPMRLTTFRSEESRSTRNEDHNIFTVLRSRTEEKKQRRRREWQRQQERERQHEKLKQQKILEYERKRAQALKKYAEEKSSRHSQSKSDSESPLHGRYRGRSKSTASKSDNGSPSYVRYRGRSTSTASKSDNLHEKLDESTNGIVPLFRGPQNAQIDTSELRRIKVDIHRNIPAKGPVTELERAILNPEDVIVKRREGEGCKPIFDREELKKVINKTNEIEEQRTAVFINKEQSASTIKSHSLSLSPIRNRVYSGYLSSYQSSHLDLNQDKTEKCDTRKDDERSDLEKRREYKEKYTERDGANKHDNNRSRSRERNSHSRPFIEERSYRDRYREKSNERSYERRDRERERNRERGRNRDRTKTRDRSRERRNIASRYIESPISVPICYGSFPPRPIVVNPMVPLRGQISSMGRGRHPTLMVPVRPFPPRFPPNMYSLGHPSPNPSEGAVCITCVKQLVSRAWI